jgi:uncharacterized protein YciI
VADRPALEPHTLVLLMRPADAPPLGDDEAEDLQRRHLAFLQEKRREGVMAAAGPFQGQPDQSWRGLCVYLVPPDRARVLAEQDPLVLRGRLIIETLTWLVPVGEVSFPAGASDRPA